MTAITTVRPVPTTTPDTTPDTPVATPSLWRAGVASGLVAAVATVAVATGARALDIPVAIEGEAIPVLGFAQLTLFFTAIGVLIARRLARKADRPRSTFLITTLVLTALSCIPDVLVSADVASKVTLIASHLVAASIVIPVLTGRLAEQRGA